MRGGRRNQSEQERDIQSERERTGERSGGGVEEKTENNREWE